jgi:phosphatidylethanolamine/phosphatidyl-N-methylethanolamine N-methyltransferase
MHAPPPLSAADARAERRLFLGKFLRHGTSIASLCPTSWWLARSMVESLPLERARCILELGAGTGPVTRWLEMNLPSDCRLISLERDPDFCAFLRTHTQRTDVIEADALELETLLRERGITKLDGVISGLPLPSFSAADRAQVLQAVTDRLPDDAPYVQLTEIALWYRHLYRQSFHDVRFHLELRNIPPAGHYVCHRPKRPIPHTCA